MGHQRAKCRLANVRIGIAQQFHEPANRGFLLAMSKQRDGDKRK